MVATPPACVRAGNEPVRSTIDINKIRDLNGEGSYGITLPKDDLLRDGLLDVDGDLDDGRRAVVVERTGEGEWHVQLADERIQTATQG